MGGAFTCFETTTFWRWTPTDALLWAALAKNPSPPSGGDVALLLGAFPNLPLGGAGGAFGRVWDPAPATAPERSFQKWLRGQCFMGHIFYYHLQYTSALYFGHSQPKCPKTFWCSSGSRSRTLEILLKISREFWRILHGIRVGFWLLHHRSTPQFRQQIQSLNCIFPATCPNCVGSTSQIPCPKWPNVMSHIYEYWKTNFAILLLPSLLHVDFLHLYAALWYALLDRHRSRQLLSTSTRHPETKFPRRLNKSKWSANSKRFSNNQHPTYEQSTIND